MQTSTIEIAGLPPETLRTLIERAREMGATVEEYARSLIEKGLAQESINREEFEHLDAIEGIREGLESMKQGTGTPAREFFAELRQEFGLPEKRP